MTRKYSIVKKDRLFYDKFEYSIGFALNEANCLRVLDHAMIDDLLDRRKKWRESALKRWNNTLSNHAAILMSSWQDITENTATDLHSVADVLMNTKSKFKLVVSMNQCYVYTNELDLIDTLDTIDFLSNKTYSQALVTRYKNTIQLKNPKNQLRSYFRSVKISAEQKDHLMNFFHNQGNQIRVGPAMSRWLDQPFEYMQDYFFVDHDSHAWLTMLGLICPNIIRKTMHIIPAK
jgi:hypothetical protein